MTTRKFSAIHLFQPRYSLDLGKFVSQERKQAHEQEEENEEEKQQQQREQVKKLSSTCLPRFSQLAQVIEVTRPGFTLPGRVGSNIKDFLGSYCVIENVRPELFVRRDFISKFIDKGTILIAHLSDHQAIVTTADGKTIETNNDDDSCEDCNGRGSSRSVNDAQNGGGIGGYRLSTKNNVMLLTMNAKQYHRFGLVAKKVILPSSATVGPPRKRLKPRASKGSVELYLVEIDLNDERIRKNNKYQDRLVSALRRLSPINRVYFRFMPDKSKLEAIAIADTVDLMRKANELSLDFFNHVIEEYALDGCQPVPLTKCTLDGQKIDWNRINYSQQHPDLNYTSINHHKRATIPLKCHINETELTQHLLEIVEWLGYQLLRLDCDRLAKLFCWNVTEQRFDVSCTQISGMFDHKQLQDNLPILFHSEDNAGSSEVMLRALILYDERPNHLHNLQVLNDCASLDARTPTTLSGQYNDICVGKAGIFYLQNCSKGSASAREITVIGMSNASD